MQQELRRIREVVVIEWTVRRRLKEANLTPQRPAMGPKLTEAHWQARLQFAREHTIETLRNTGRFCSLTSAECVPIAVIGEVRPGLQAFR